MRRNLIVALGLLALGGMAACGDEDPTEIGGDLIGSGVHTFEVVLDAADFLEADTTYDNIGSLYQVGFRAVALDFEGVLDAHTLFSIRRPITVTYEDGGQTQADSIIAFRGATVTLVVDSTTVDGPTELEVLTVAESWDRPTTSWELRYDTAGVAEPWTTPGGTTGSLVATQTLEPGIDTLRIQIDSTNAALWADTAAASRGALIRTSTPGARVIFRSVRFSFDVIPEERTDTTLAAGSVGGSTLILTPEPTAAPTSEVRTSGVPLWRTLFRFKPLSDLVLDCSTGGEPCTVPLSDVSVNLAALLLEPVPGGAHRPEVPLKLQGRAVLEAEGVPLIRSPLSGQLGVMEDSIPVEAFSASPPSPGPVAVPITEYVRRLANPRGEGFLWLAILPQAEGGSLGYASFASLDSAQPPRLRLVVSIPNEELFR